jgi:uncharacterized NAD-dependent epimerase/dehydratase family protein
MDVAILAHEQFPGRAKTALGILRYADDDVVAVLDRAEAGTSVAEHVADAGDQGRAQDAPIVASMADAPPCDALLIGIAPIGGGFEDDWRPDVRTALERGCDVVAGLHYLLGEDEEFVRIAAEHGCSLRDVREPPDDLTVAEGTADAVPAEVVLTVATDCSSGKMTASYELRDAARERGLEADVVPTGQTGIMIDGDGIAIDRAISDFAAGAVERMVLARGDCDLLLVEGQGAIGHPAYSGVTTSILHGAQPDGLVLCHEHGREAIHGYEEFAIPPIDRVADLYERLAAPVREASVRAGMLDTSGLAGDRPARDALDEYGATLGAPVTDPIRFGADEVLDAVLGEAVSA